MGLEILLCVVWWLFSRKRWGSAAMLVISLSLWMLKECGEQCVEYNFEDVKE